MRLIKKYINEYMSDIDEYVDKNDAVMKKLLSCHKQLNGKYALNECCFDKPCRTRFAPAEGFGQWAFTRLVNAFWYELGKG